MRRLKKIISLVRALQFAVAVLLTFLMIKAIKLLYVALRQEGSL